MSNSRSERCCEGDCKCWSMIQHLQTAARRSIIFSSLDGQTVASQPMARRSRSPISQRIRVWYSPTVEIMSTRIRLKMRVRHVRQRFLIPGRQSWQCVRCECRTHYSSHIAKRPQEGLDHTRSRTRAEKKNAHWSAELVRLGVMVEWRSTLDGTWELMGGAGS
jgi:hypothetical protein